tara:strand:+ start:357 stop:524 length:168 start_codon:yes stop_codon:yes gene_type:complete
MKNLTTAETEQVSGGVYQFFIGYFGSKLLDATLSAASNVDNMYQVQNRSLPYNRL